MNPESVKTFFAIDLSKKTLQVKTTRTSFKVDYNEAGLTQLMRRLEAAENPWVVCEATGGYERLLLRWLHARQLPVCLLNPSLLRAFARSEGVKAKSDPIDAEMILKFAQQKTLRPSPPSTPAHEELVALLDRRSHLVEHAAREKNRLDKCCKYTRASIEETIAYFETKVAEIEERIRACTDQDNTLARRCMKIQSVKGVGEITAWSLLAYLPEITEVSRNQAVALAGLAPFDRDSGDFKGKRCIQGGREKIRRCLYMAATSAATHNHIIRAYVNGLKARGKPHKVAMTAAMRKLIVHLRSILKISQKPLHEDTVA